MATATKTTKSRRSARRKLAARHTRPDFPYTMRLPDGRTLCVEVPERWVVADRGGEPAFVPQGVAFLDRVRALFISALDRPPSAGYIARLREALGLTQREFGRLIDVDKMTVSRWERGAMRPSAEAVKTIEKLRKEAIRHGVTIAT